MSGASQLADPCYAFNPANEEDMSTTLREAALFINAERAALGLPNAGTLIVIGLDVAYKED